MTKLLESPEEFDAFDERQDQTVTIPEWGGAQVRLVSVDVPTVRAMRKLEPAEAENHLLMHSIVKANGERVFATPEAFAKFMAKRLALGDGPLKRLLQKCMEVNGLGEEAVDKAKGES